MAKINEQKLESMSEQRFTIIHKNFFLNLSARKISFSKYAEDNLVDRTLGSHWKSGKSKMTVDQIYQAAVYFGITVNDLYYSDKEKKKIAVLSDSSYDPIIAQQTLKIRLMSDSFEKPSSMILAPLAIFAIIAIVTYVLLRLSPYLILVMLIGLYLSNVSFKNTFAIDKTLSINYLDDIYYKRESNKNKYLIYQFVIRVVSVIGISFVIFLTDVIDIVPQSNIEIILSMYVTFSIIYIIIIIFSFVFMDIRYNLIIDDHQIKGYKSTLTIFNFSLVLLFAAILLLTYDLSKYWLLVLICLLVSILNLLDFILVSKNYSKYKLMYEADGKEPRELFSKKSE